MVRNYIYGGLCTLLVVFSILAIFTYTYDIQYSSAQSSMVECDKLKVENVVSSDRIKDLSGCVLVGVNLRNADLSGADLSETDLRGPSSSSFFLWLQLLLLHHFLKGVGAVG